MAALRLFFLKFFKLSIRFIVCDCGQVGASASATFHAANPRNDQKIQQTYLTVEQLGTSGWTAVRTDNDWDTTFQWAAGPADPFNVGISGQSKATVTWDIPTSAPTGTYRLCYFGNNKKVTGSIGEFSGCSSNFKVTA